MASHALNYDPVPEVNPVGGQAPAEHIDVNADQFGGGVARSLGTLGQGLEKASSEGFSVLDQQAQMDARTHAAELHSWQSDQTTDATEQFLSLKGKAASMAVPDFKNRIEELHKQALDEAPNAYTKQLVNSEGRALIDRNYALAARHAASEKKVWEGNTATSASDSYRNDAVLSATNSNVPNVSDDPVVMDQLFKADQEARNLWAGQGYEGDALDGKVAAARGKGVTEIVKALISDESPTGIQRANDFYHSEKNNIDAGSRIAIQNALKGPMTQLGGQSKSTDIIYGPQVPQSPIDIAKRFVGADENAQRDTLTKFIGKVGGQSVDPAKTAWCAAFVNGVLREAGLQGTGSLAARSFLNVGKVVDGQPQEGDVVVLSRGDPSAGLGHVGFYAGPGSSPGTVRILAGNQGNKVAYAEYPESQVLGVRRITAADIGQTPQIDAVASRPQVSKGEFMQRAMNDPDLIARPQLMAATLAHGNKIYEADHLIQTQDSAAFKVRLQNSSAEALDTGTVQNPIPHEEFIQSMGSVAGEQAYGDYQKAIQLGSDIKSTASLSPEETNNLLKKYEPQPGPDYIGQATRRAELDKAIAHNEAAKKKDPAGFLISQTDSGGAAYKQFQTLMQDKNATPEMRRTYAGMFADKMLSEQIRLGVDPADARVVPKWYTDDLNKKLTDPASAGGAGQVAAILKNEADMWGEHWPDVYRQMAPDTQPIIRVLGSGVKDEAATALINSFKVKEGDLLKNEENPVDTMKTITSAIDTNLLPFYRSLSGDKQNQTKTDFRTMATRLATVYLQNNTGMQGASGITGTSGVAGNVQASAEKAVNDLLNYKYDFKDTYRVPKDSGVSADIVQAGAVAAREMLGKTGLEIASKRDDVGGLSDEYLSSNTANSLRRNGVWLTDPKEKGLVLMQGNGNAVRRPDGSPFVLTWKQLSDFAADRAKLISSHSDYTDPTLVR